VHRTFLFFVTLCAALSTACKDDTRGPKIEQPFCFTMEDADSFVLSPFDDDPSSGQIQGRLVTDESADVHDPQLVAFVAYTLTNLDVGGSPQLGETDIEGKLFERVGAGNWRLQLSAAKGAYDCVNSVDLVVEAGQQTDLCVDVACE
jgi:hypothetical protein